MSDTIKAEVAYALPDKQTLLSLQVDKDDSLEVIIKASGILELYPEIDLAVSKVGIFSKLAKLTDTLHDGDRIEIYRPLIVDPKEVRKQRALKASAGKNK
ncbi:RnfH family protein [Kangiella sp. HZ709]|uniref:RnfH family protein n=1 Tax=Kangiella sp. HZ709 TaxID=2666328 RepID=UPI0012B084C5|nr:RnfH family protein [Kangiella sp. HZ709]MRX28543.1 RnfH family protein [Kangiella sp. HZ709]